MRSSQADPKFQSTFCYARISARAVREALIREKGYRETQLPTRQTIGEILNRLGYRLKNPKRPNLVKKISQTDAIFENVFRENQLSDDNQRSLRVSIDSKAKVKIGIYRGVARRGQLRQKRQMTMTLNGKLHWYPLVFSILAMTNYRFTWVSRLKPL